MISGDNIIRLWPLGPVLALLLSGYVATQVLEERIANKAANMSESLSAITTSLVTLADRSADRDRVLSNEVKLIATRMAAHEASSGHPGERERRERSDELMRAIVERLARVEASLEADRALKERILFELNRLTQTLDKRTFPGIQQNGWWPPSNRYATTQEVSK